MKRLIAVIAKLVGRTPVWEIPKTKLAAPVPKEKRIKNPLLPIVIVLISLVLSLVIWNTIALNGISRRISNLEWDISGINHDVGNLGWDLGNMQKQLDTLYTKLDNTQRDVAIIKYYLER